MVQTVNLTVRNRAISALDRERSKSDRYRSVQVGNGQISIVIARYRSVTVGFRSLPSGTYLVSLDRGRSIYWSLVGLIRIACIEWYGLVLQTLASTIRKCYQTSRTIEQKWYFNLSSDTNLSWFKLMNIGSGNGF